MLNKNEIVMATFGQNWIEETNLMEDYETNILHHNE